jgi:hypothetical protein
MVDHLIITHRFKDIWNWIVLEIKICQRGPSDMWVVFISHCSLSYGKSIVSSKESSPQTVMLHIHFRFPVILSFP